MEDGTDTSFNIVMKIIEMKILYAINLTSH